MIRAAVITLAVAAIVFAVALTLTLIFDPVIYPGYLTY